MQPMPRTSRNSLKPWHILQSLKSLQGTSREVREDERKHKELEEPPCRRHHRRLPEEKSMSGVLSLSSLKEKLHINV